MDQLNDLTPATGAVVSPDIALLAIGIALFVAMVPLIRFVDAKRLRLLVQSLNELTNRHTTDHLNDLRHAAADRIGARLGLPHRTFAEVARKYSKFSVWTLMVGSALLLILPAFAALAFLVTTGTHLDGLALDSVIVQRIFGWKELVGDIFQNLSIVFGSLVAVFLFLWLADYVVRRMVVLWRLSRNKSETDNLEPGSKYIIFLTSVVLFVPVFMLWFISSVFSHSSNVKAEVILFDERAKKRCIDPDDMGDNRKKALIAASFEVWGLEDDYACSLACHVSQDLTAYVLGLGFGSTEKSCRCPSDGIPHLCDSQAAKQASLGEFYGIEEDVQRWFKIVGTGDLVVLEAVADHGQDPEIKLYVEAGYLLTQKYYNDDHGSTLDARLEFYADEDAHYFARVSSAVGGSVKGVRFRVSEGTQRLDI